MTYLSLRGGGSFTIYLNSNCVYHNELMQAEYIDLEWVRTSNMYAPQVGDYVEYNGRKFKILELTPWTMAESGGRLFKQRFFAEWEEWRNRTLFYDRGSAIEAEWKITQTPAYMLSIVRTNLQRCGFGTYTYNVANEAKLKEMRYVDFNGLNIVEALNAIADAWECEWWLESGTIYLGACKKSTTVQLTQSSDLVSLSASDSQNGSKATRLYVFGTDRNIGKYYRKSAIFTAQDSDAMAYLMANKPAGYSAAVTDSERRLNADMFPEANRRYKTDNVSKQLATYSGVFQGYSQQEETLHVATDVICQCSESDYGKRTLSIPSLSLSMETAGNGTVDITSAAFVVLNTDGKELARKAIPVTDYSAGSLTNYAADVYVGKNESVKVEYVLDIVRYPPREGEEDTDSYDISFGNMAIQIKSANAGANVSLTINGVQYAGVLNPLYHNGESDLAYGIFFNGTPVANGTQFKINNLYKYNVPAGYYTSQYSNVVAGVSNSVLLLPTEPVYNVDGTLYRESELEAVEGKLQVYSGYGYIDLQDNMSRECIIEGIVTLDEVYPRTQSVITHVEAEERRQENAETGVTDMWKVYMVRASDLIGFRPTWILDGVTLSLTMQTGLLAGMSFDVSLEDVYNDTTQAYETWFKLVRDESNYGIAIPNETMKPAVGDKFILQGYNIDYVDAELTAKAEVELVQKGLEYLQDLNADKKTYTCELVAGEMQERGLLTMNVGTQVTLTTDSMGTISSRIRSVDRYLDDRRMVITLGKERSYSRFASIEQTINAKTRR